MKTNKRRLKVIQQIPTAYIPPVVFGDEFFAHPSAVLGCDGFGYEWDGERLVEFPHRGDVCIGRDVKIGAGVCIARATMEGECTEIGEGTKIDNLVHIAHNVKIGRHCLIGSGVVIAGSVVIGDRCQIWGNVVINKKHHIGNDVEIGAGSVVRCDIPDGELWVGNPAKKVFRCL